MKYLNGKEVSVKLKESLKIDIDTLYKQCDERPNLAIISVGDDYGSKIYLKNKIKSCEEVGIKCEVIRFPINIDENILIETINTLNLRIDVNAILCELPLPKHINTKRVLKSISVSKDVEGLNAVVLEEIFNNDYEVAPCTPKGILKLLKFYNIGLIGKHCVIVGRSNTVGKSLALMLLNEDSTVTVCHSKTKNLKDICRTADILISAIGVPNFITADMLSENSIVIDVGINRHIDGSICGDVSKDVYNKVAFITPVPNGVGPMTVLMLIYNVLSLFKKQKENIVNK